MKTKEELNALKEEEEEVNSFGRFFSAGLYTNHFKKAAPYCSLVVLVIKME